MTTKDIEQLKSITKGDSTAAVRAYMERSVEVVAAFFDTEPEKVIRWASRFHSLGLKGLENKERGHRRKKFGDETRDAVKTHGWRRTRTTPEGLCIGRFKDCAGR